MSSGTHGPGCPCPYCASYSDPMADFVTVKVNKKEYDRIIAERDKYLADYLMLQQSWRLLDEENAALTRERNRYRETLERVASDIPACRQNTPISYLQGIAREALKS